MLSEKIKKYRLDNNLTQQDLASKLFVTRNSISKWENNNGYPSIDILKDLAKLMNTTIDELLSENDYKTIVMEVSSQGLNMGRLDSIKFNYGVFTNLTQDHLDYHKTMENYALAKQKLFSNLKENGIGIINSGTIGSNSITSGTIHVQCLDLGSNASLGATCGHDHLMTGIDSLFNGCQIFFGDLFFII